MEIQISQSEKAIVRGKGRPL